MAVWLLIVLVVAMFFSSTLLFMSGFLNGFVVVPVAAAYYYSVAVRPTINREATLALRTVFRAIKTEPPPPPQGIGGWLILPVIGLVIAPILNSYALFTQFWPIFRDGVWEKLTTPGSDVYHYLWGPLITFEIFGTLVTSVLAIATLVLLFRKSKKTPVFVIALLGISTLLQVLDHFFADLIPALHQ